MRGSVGVGRETGHLHHGGRDAAVHVPRRRALRRDDGDNRAVVGGGKKDRLTEER